MISISEHAKTLLRPIRAFVESDVGVVTLYWNAENAAFFKPPVSVHLGSNYEVDRAKPSPQNNMAAKEQSVQKAKMKMQAMEMISANPVHLPKRRFGLEAQGTSLTGTILDSAAQTAIDTTSPPVAPHACRHALVELMLARLSALEDQQGREEIWSYDEDHTFCDELQHILEESWPDH